MNTLVRTPNDGLQAFLRVALGVIIFPHGAQKLLGWFGGNGYAGTVGFFESQLGIPPVVSLLVILIEFFGGLMLIFGVFSRLAALGIIANMLGAMFLVHLPNGFFWTNGGVEIHLLIIAVALVVVLRGGGALSFDQALSERQAAGRLQSA